MESLPVIFRAEKSDGEVTAVFPTVGEGSGHAGCYAHIGQHSACSRAWYHTTRAATPAEYAPLLIELRRIYETGDDAVRLVVRKRWTR